ncbi:acyl-CoA thioesterase [Bradyrhizobium sp. 2TAF24]|uniref:acyl-CoA thioesterase n=1 Tax=Bradyrhizobium sp. 2TAF24 TaxID=3233011 RepID=UPI003F917AE1
MFKTSLTIEWGDCDEAGIVFYPNYFYWLDSSFQRLLRARGLSQREVRKRFGAVTPIVQAHADFKSPARYDDVLDIEVTVALDRERRFKVDYRFSTGGRLVGTGHEVRAWALIDAEGGLKGAAVDPQFWAMLTAEDAVPTES